MKKVTGFQVFCFLIGGPFTLIAALLNLTVAGADERKARRAKRAAEQRAQQIKAYRSALAQLEAEA